MTNTILTKNGMDFVTSAGTAGLYIAIKYCLPIFDYRLSTDMHDGIHTSAITYESTIAITSGNTIPTGEIIWFTSGSSDYTISQHYILSAAGLTKVTSGSNTRISGCPQSTMGLGMNLYKNQPLSNAVSGTIFLPPSTNDFWLVDSVTSASIVGSNTPTDLTDRKNYWQVVDYYPVVDGSGNVRGSFKAHISQAVGRFKFNKIGFYACQMLNDVEVTKTAPVFFAECFVKETAVKSNILDEGFDDFIVDGNIDLTPLNSYGTSGFYITSGNLWERTVGGLYSPDPVGIGSFQGDVASPQANLHVRYTTSNPRQNTLLRLDASGTNGTSAYQILNVDTLGNLILSSTSGNFYVKEGLAPNSIINPGDGYVEMQTTLYPDSTANTRSLGSNAKRFDNVFAQTVNAPTISGTSITALNFNNVSALTVSASNITALTMTPADLRSPFVSATSLAGLTVTASTLNATNANIGHFYLTSGSSISACGIAYNIANGSAITTPIVTPAANTNSLIFLTILNPSSYNAGDFVCVSQRNLYSFVIKSTSYGTIDVAWMIVNPI